MSNPLSEVAREALSKKHGELGLMDLPAIGKAGEEALHKFGIMTYWQLLAQFVFLGPDAFAVWIKQTLPPTVSNDNIKKLIFLLQTKQDNLRPVLVGAPILSVGNEVNLAMADHV